MNHTCLILPLFLFSGSLPAQQFQLSYSFDSVKTTSGTVDPTPVLSAPGTKFSSFTAHGVAANPNASNRFSFTGWGTGALNGATLYASLTGTLDTGRYYQVSAAPLAGNQLELDSVSFYMQRSGSGIRTFSVRSSLDQFTSNVPVTLPVSDTVLTVEPGNTVFLNRDLTNFPTSCTLHLGGNTFSALGKQVTFRFYAFNSESGAGTFSIDAVNFYGKTSFSTGIPAQAIPDLQICPVPSADGLFRVSTSEGVNGFPAGAVIRVYTIQGSLVWQTILSGAEPQEVNLQDQADGVYFLVVSDGVKTAKRRICICR